MIVWREGGSDPLSPLAQTSKLSFPMRRLRNRLEAYGFLAPAGGLVLLFFIIPVVILFILSLSDLKSANITTLDWWLPANWEPGKLRQDIWQQILP